MIDILQPYEVLDRKSFSLQELANLIHKRFQSLGEEEPELRKKELLFELVAFKLQEKSDLWGNYYVSTL